jgi:hypothetical protein
MAPLVRGLTTANVGLVVTMNGSVPREITVQVVDFNIDVVFTTVRFNQKPKQVFPYNG